MSFLFRNFEAFNLIFSLNGWQLFTIYDKIIFIAQNIT